MILIGLVALVAACGLALRLGGPAERWGALLSLACWLGFTLLLLVRGPGHGWALILPDVAYGLGLLALLVRYGRLWIFAAFATQGVVLLLHALLSASAARPPYIFALLFNGASFVCLAALVAGAVQHRAAVRRPSSVRRRRVRSGARVSP